MIAYLYLKSNKQIVSIVNDIHTITDTDVLGISDYAKGNDFSMLDILCVNNVLTKTVEDAEVVPLEIGDILVVEGLNNFRDELLMKNVRVVRNTLLTDSDWTQLSDSPLSTEQKDAWSTYRQQLRDFPSVVDLDNIVYPSKPE